MYGMGIPILFPVACVTYFVFWHLERLGIAYTYRIPPALDDKMTINALNMLTFAPVLFMCNGYWMLSNMQIFQSKVYPL